jgi:Uma2 family endonuclease
MSSMPVVEPMTAARYMALVDDGEYRWAQLVGGELIMDPPKLSHQLVCMQILVEIELWTRAEAGRGLVSIPLAVHVGEHDVYQPDIVFFGDERAPARDALPPYPVPDLAVEVRSPSTWRYDIGAKKAGYERSGLPELWLVDTAAEEILIFRRSRADAPTFDVALELTRDETLSSALLAGFALPVAAIFAR